MFGIPLITVSYFSWIAQQVPRYEQAATMKKEHCKQVAFVEGKTHTGVATGIAVTGKVTPVTGVVSSTDDDQYTYSCDSGKTYTLSYDYTKFLNDK